MNTNILSIFCCFILCGCISLNQDKEIKSELWCTWDNKDNCDSLFLEQKDISCDSVIHNWREVRFWYKIKNTSATTFYIPFKHMSCDSVFSMLKIMFINKADTIRPNFQLDRLPYNSNYIAPNDSVVISINIFHFWKWQTNICNTNTDIRDLAKMLHVEYVFNKKDIQNKNQIIPSIEFVYNPNKCYFHKVHGSFDNL